MASITRRRTRDQVPPDEAAPPEFLLAAEAVRVASVPAGLVRHDLAPPRRLAPHALAVAGHVDPALVPGLAGDGPGPRAADDHDDEHETPPDTTGRFVLLHDPACPPGWNGPTRIVALLTSVVERDLAEDPLLADIAWSWLAEELRSAGADWTELGGTVTRVSSQTFGSLSQRPPDDRVEVRASWSPVGDAGVHLTAWGGALCRLGGMPPVAPGVAVLRRH